MNDKQDIRQKLGRRKRIPGIYIGTILIFFIFGLFNSKFLSLKNIALIARNSSILLIASVGMTLVILMSQIDLSIGSVMSLSGVLVTVLHNKGVPLIFCILAALIISTLVGMVNGFMIAKLKFDYWLVSFSVMGIIAGLSLVLADSRTVPLNNDFLAFIGKEKVFGISIVTLIAVFLFGAMVFMLRKSKLGANIYSIGGSEIAAHLSGINVVRVRMAVYAISSAYAGIAGILLASMSVSASPIAGGEYSFTTMAAVVIGGTSFAGGKGGLGGTMVGVLLLRILASGLNFLGLRASLQKAIIGFVIVSVLLFDAINMRRRQRRDQRRRYVDE